MSTVLIDTGSAHTITLRSPLLGDERRVKLNAFYRRSRAGSLWGWKRTPEVQTLNLRYGDMNRPTINALRAFMIAAIRPIKITLDNGDQWQGDIMNDLDTLHVQHQDNTFTLNFEGVKIA